MADRLSRRPFLFLTAGAIGLSSGCTESSVRSAVEQDAGTSSPTKTAQPTVAEPPADLVLEASSLPRDSGTTWNETRREEGESGLHVNYEVAEDGEYSHQVTVGITRRQTVGGAVFDHDKLVEAYTEEHDAAVSELSFGDVGSLVTFADEAHAIATHRNVVVHVQSYGGPSEQAIEVARRQVEKLSTEVPRPSSPTPA